MTWSPGLTLSTPGPFSTTIPAASCPSTIGNGSGQSPFMMCAHVVLLPSCHSGPKWPLLLVVRCIQKMIQLRSLVEWVEQKAKPISCRRCDGFRGCSTHPAALRLVAGESCDCVSIRAPSSLLRGARKDATVAGGRRRSHCEEPQATGQSRATGSERNVVVEVVDRGAAAGRGGGGARLVAEAAAGIAFIVAAFDRRAAGAAGAVEHRQFAAKALQHDLGRVALLAAVVGPFAGLQRALDVNLGALLQVFLGNLGKPLVEDHDAVPFGALLALARHLVAPGLGGGDRQIGDAHAVLRRTDLGVAAEIADENHLVDTTSHRSTALSCSSGLPSYQALEMFLLYSSHECI